MKTKITTVKAESTIAYDSAMADVNRDLERMRKSKAYLIANRKVIGKALRTLNKSLEKNDHLFVGTDYDSRPYIYVTFKNLESFKCLKLETMLATLMNMGEAKKTVDWPSSLNRDYKFNLGAFDVTLSAFVRDDSPTCKRVIVGTETVQVHRYEIACD